MLTQLRLRTLFLVTILSMMLAPIGIGEAANQSAVSCSCVTYIKNRFGLSGAVGGSGGAKDMGGYLRDLGFRQVSSPVTGAIVIFQPSFGTGINQAYGHVGVIASYSSVDSNRNWRISVTGANQGGSTYTASNCTNVATVYYKNYAKNTSSVSYWVR